MAKSRSRVADYAVYLLVRTLVCIIQILSWQSALALQDYREDLTRSGTVYLHAGIRRDQVKVQLTATVFDDEGEDR